MKTLKAFDEAKISKDIDALEKELRAELGIDAADEQEDTADQTVEQAEQDLDDAEELMDEDDFDEEVIKIEEEEDDDDDEIGDVQSDIDAVEERIAKEEIVAACKEVESAIAMAEEKDACGDGEEKPSAKKASEEKKGIEDEIGDEAHGGDPSVSDVAPGGDDVDVSTDKEVFPTNSEFVAKITKRLDRVATELEKRGMKRMAFRVDQLSDKIEASIRK